MTGDHDNNVIPFPTTTDLYDGVICGCGSAWWSAAGITLDETGQVTGYAHPVRCLECGEPLRATPNRTPKRTSPAAQATEPAADGQSSNQTPRDSRRLQYPGDSPE